LHNYKNFSTYSKLYPVIYTIRPKFPRFFNFWSSECHQSLLGNGRVVTKINAVNPKLPRFSTFGAVSAIKACLFGRVVTEVDDHQCASCFAETEKPLRLKPKDVSEAVKYIVWFFFQSPARKLNTGICSWPYFDATVGTISFGYLADVNTKKGPMPKHQPSPLN